MDDEISTNGQGDNNSILKKLASDYGEKSTDESDESDSDSGSSSDSEESSQEDIHSSTPNSEHGYVTDEELSAPGDAQSTPQPEEPHVSSVVLESQVATQAMDESLQTTDPCGDQSPTLKKEVLIEPTNNIQAMSQAAEELVELKDQVYRERRSSCSSSSSSSSSSSDDSVIQLSPDSSDSESEQREKQNGDDKSDRPKKPREPRKSPRVKGELSLEDLDPIVDLQISVPEDKLQPIGQIKNIVGCIVTVESFENKPALDLMTVLFFDEGRKALGHVFELFGRTSQPYYCVRFNSAEHVKERGVEPGMTVYAAPGTEHTRYVFLAQIERFRGTDASWKDDIETPNELVEYSDDEMEKCAKNKKRKPRPRKNQPFNRSFPPPPPNEDSEVANRFARKRNFGCFEGPEMNGANGHVPNRFTPPIGANFGPPRGPHYGNMGPIRSPVFRPMGGGFRPGIRNSGCPNPDFFGAQNFQSIGPYGPPAPPYGPPPSPSPFNPYFGGNGMPYRQPYETDLYNQGWWNYANQRPGLSTHWYPPAQAYYDHQTSWGRYHGQSDIPTFSAPCTPPPPPPTSVPYSVPPEPFNIVKSEENPNIII